MDDFRVQSTLTIRAPRARHTLMWLLQLKKVQPRHPTKSRGRRIEGPAKDKSKNELTRLVILVPFCCVKILLCYIRWLSEEVD